MALPMLDRLLANNPGRFVSLQKEITPVSAIISPDGKLRILAQACRTSPIPPALSPRWIWSLLSIQRSPSGGGDE